MTPAYRDWKQRANSLARHVKITRLRRGLGSRSLAGEAYFACEAR
jgi:hypothetical protein